MSTSHSSKQLSRPTTARRSTAPPAPKLRDSCHACSSSKIKCGREKPSCARCVKRGLDCEYLVTKRAGRKHDSRPKDKTNGTQPVPAPVSRPRTPTWSTHPEMGTGSLASPSIIHPSPRPQTSTNSDVLPSLISHTDTSLSGLTSLSTDFDDFIASSLSFPALDVPDYGILAEPSKCPGGGGPDDGLLDLTDNSTLFRPGGVFSVMNEAISEIPPQSTSHTPLNRQASITSESFSDLRSESPCYCMVSALGLLNKLFSNCSKSCMCSGGGGKSNETVAGHHQLPTIQSVVTENAQTIEAVNKMLQCPCSQDDYLLSTIALIVFKVLGWYAAAARGTPGTTTDGSQSPHNSLPPDHHHHRRDSSTCHSEHVQQQPAVVGSYYIDGEDQGRMAAQLVLSELHRVQRLINRLSNRLSNRLKGQETQNFASDGPAKGQDMHPDGESAFSWSTTMFDQLATGLRKRLRSLSLEIVEMLRQG